MIRLKNKVRIVKKDGSESFLGFIKSEVRTNKQIIGFNIVGKNEQVLLSDYDVYIALA